MKSIHIRNLDERVIEGLKRRAQRHHRSLQKEVERLLADAARMSPPDETPQLKLHTTHTSSAQSNWNRESIYGDDGR